MMNPRHGSVLQQAAHTNNTGEMTAMHIALTRTLTRAHGAGNDVIHSDSQYTIKMTTGEWMPHRGHRNTCIVANLRALWRKVLRARPGEVSLKHVRSHTGLPGNDLADWLADMAADSQKEVDTTSAEKWLTNWIAERKKQGTAGGGAAAAAISHQIL